MGRVIVFSAQKYRKNTYFCRTNPQNPNCMNFYHSVTPFGNYERHTLSNDAGDRVFIVPAHGACLTGLEFGRLSVLDGYDTPEQLTENKWSKSAVLFPFPNRLRDGEYEWAGKKYQFPINNAATGNAIHGFGKTLEMHVESVEQLDDAQGIALTCIYQHDETAATWAYYPFACTFRVEYHLGVSELTFSMQVVSEVETGTMPVGLGWHPYFRIAPTVDETALRLPDDVQILDINERMLPTGDKKPFTTFDQIQLIGDTTLDNGFLVWEKTPDDDGEPRSVASILVADDGALFVQQIVGDASANFVQVFTPPHRRSIAIEPMTCNIDAFNNHDGLAALAKGETCSLYTHLSWQKNEDFNLN